MSLFTLAQYVTYVPSWRKTFLVLYVTFIMLSFLEMAADVITTVWHHLMTRLDLWVSHVDCTQTRHTRSRATQRRRQIGGFSKEGQIGGSFKEGKWGRRASMTGSSNTLLLAAPPPFSSAMIVNGLHLCQAFAQWTFWLPLPPPTAAISARLSKCFKFFNSKLIFKMCKNSNILAPLRYCYTSKWVIYPKTSQWALYI